MGDSYQAIYDAVRSRISGCDAGNAIRDAALSALDFGIARQILQEQVGLVGYEHSRPAAVFRPRLYIDGNQWCALYGENLQDGVAGFGDSPSSAMDDFDRAWWKKIAATKAA